MVTTKIPETKYRTLYELVLDHPDIDISDDIWDWGVAFCISDMKWEDCEDYYSRCMLLFALNIKVVNYSKDWYSCCKVCEFIEENRQAFDEFLNEAYKEGYRPCDSEKPLSYDEDDGYFELYMEAMEHLIVGNFSEQDYEKLYKLLTKENNLIK